MKPKHLVRRHFTIANCMDDLSYKAYINAIKQFLDGEKIEKNELDSVIKREEPGTFTLTVKNYWAKKGLSMRLCDDYQDRIFEVQGPMGKGLDIQPDGTHIAFSAGTGCLVFVDLVAHLVRKNLGLLGADEEAQVGDKFKLVMFMSFPKKEDAIAYDLCAGL